MLSQALEQVDCTSETVEKHLLADHYESLMLDGFKDQNARALIDLADRIASCIAEGEDPAAAVRRVFSERYSRDPQDLRFKAEEQRGRETNMRETRRDILLDHTNPADEGSLLGQAFRKHGGNVSAIKREMDQHGITRSRSKIARLMDKLGFPRSRK